jgi:hypothetical protein
MIEHLCEYCNFITSHKGNYDRHLLSRKHCNKVKEYESNNIIDYKLNNLSKQNEELIKEIHKLKEIHNKNTNIIVKEARAIKKSILTILNTNFRDTPPIDYINETDFRKELELEYNAIISDTDDKLFMRIFNDYEKRKLIQTLSNLILKFVKKEDQKIQSVFNIDSARGNYATKIENFWHNDKNGLQLKKYTLDVIVSYMINVMDIFRQKLLNMHNINKIKKDITLTDYLVKYQSIMFEVNAYITNPNTHKKIIIYMCPELRMEYKLLDAITK